MAELNTNISPISLNSSPRTLASNPRSLQRERPKEPQAVEAGSLGQPLTSHIIVSTAPSSRSPTQTQGFKAAPAPGRSRGKSISLSAAVDKPTVPPCLPATNESEPPRASLAVHSEKIQSPLSPRSSLTRPCSPVSPHRAKPRRGITEGVYSSTSNTDHACSAIQHLDDESGHASCTQICNAPAHADLGIHHHPPREDETEAGTEGHCADVHSKAESDQDAAETESVAGSMLTGAGSSVPDDSISECSASDVEIYLEAHGLDDSAMRMNCVGQGSLTETDCKQAIAESPVLPLAARAGSTEETVEANTTIVVGPRAQTVPIGRGNEQNNEQEDGEGWVTNQRPDAQFLSNRRPRKHVCSVGQEGSVPLTAQHGESVRLPMEGSGTASNEVPLGTNGAQENDPSRFKSSDFQSGDENLGQVSQSLRLMSELKPTSANFKPRMGIELKPPLVEFKPSGIEFKPPQIGFTPDPPASDHAFHGASGAFTSKASTPRGVLIQHDTNYPFQSNRAAPDNDFRCQLSSAEQLDDTVYLEKLQSHVIRGDGDQTQQTEDLQQTETFDDSHKTPNVYINGLPPHFPEDQLFALAAPFGEVKSVRTFTRHVRDSESGYGFVLFETIDAAERCILALRKYRNLHPTFSKQIHKIPGTVYAQNFVNSASGSLSSFDSWDSNRDDNDSFKRRMENLHDPTSTNLYMEGLPLSIDEPTLSALVSPHRISSSRFFQTRLSHPPRIIAFVRLETRVGAEEIIERLHGRMVRGWNDAGSRISVRFADTAEQRELRRTERVTKEGDSTASRLTIAQAALLNLRGQELRQTAKHVALPVIGERRGQSAISYSYNDFGIQSPNVQVPRPVFEVDYSLAPGRYPPSQRIQSPAGVISQGQCQLYGRPAPRNVDPSMAILLDGIPTNGNTFRGSNLTPCDPYLQHHIIQNKSRMSDEYSVRPAHARMGYTATEDFIMRAHMESRRRPVPLDLASHAKSRKDCEAETASTNITTGVRGYRTRAAAINLDRKGQPAVLSEIEPVSSMNEDEFHATVTRAHGDQPQLQNVGEQDPDVTVRGSSRDYGSRNPSGHGFRSGPRPFNTPLLGSQSELGSTNVSEQHHNQHVRCTTFPYRPAPTQQQRHQQHSSMSIPSTSQRTPQHASTAIMNQNTMVHEKQEYQEYLEKHVIRRDAGNKLHSKNQHSSNSQSAYDLDNRPSPSLVSPTLTYSSQTPSTLSPATPFFGSFGSQNDGFDRNNGLDCKKLKVAGH